jgi:molybdate/tungstate transport system substrate-binding protein
MKPFSMALAAMLAVVPNSGGTVSVAYAGSLVRVMEGPMADALRDKTGLKFAGEGKGSKALAHLISAGLRTPDIFISADPKLLDDLMRGGENALISGYTVFGSARMVVAYSGKSPHRDLFADVVRRNRSILDVLSNPDVRVGRTDPQLDPKGERTVRVLHLLAAHYHHADDESKLLAKAQVFPEEDLAVRVESGELDAGFFYSTEIPDRGLQAIELPGDSNLSQEISYALAVLRHAPHPDAAKTFAEFVLTGGGRAVLERAGVSYFSNPQVTGKP